jgi:hypothetical protein
MTKITLLVALLTLSACAVPVAPSGPDSAPLPVVPPEPSEARGDTILEAARTTDPETRAATPAVRCWIVYTSMPICMNLPDGSAACCDVAGAPCWTEREWEPVCVPRDGQSVRCCEPG